MSGRSSPVGGASNNARSPKVFFSFSYDEDRHRAEVIYEAWQGRRPPGVCGHVGSWVAEQGKALAEDEVKRAIREAVDQTTVTCVLIGAHTWENRWVRYEIARSVERGNGLVAVRISGIADPKTQQRTVSGWSWNPLAYVGIGKIKSGDYLLFENINGQWSRYQDHPLTLPKPAHVPDMSVGYVQPLSVGLNEYDYVAQNGSENLDAWIAKAAAKR